MFCKNVYIIHMYTSSLRQIPFRRGLESFLKFSFYKDKEDQMHLHLLVLWSLDVRPIYFYPQALVSYLVEFRVSMYSCLPGFSVSGLVSISVVS